VLKLNSQLFEQAKNRAYLAHIQLGKIPKVYDLFRVVNLYLADMQSAVFTSKSRNFFEIHYLLSLMEKMTEKIPELVEQAMKS